MTFITFCQKSRWDKADGGILFLFSPTKIYLKKFVNFFLLIIFYTVDNQNINNPFLTTLNFKHIFEFQFHYIYHSIN